MTIRSLALDKDIEDMTVQEKRDILEALGRLDVPMAKHAEGLIQSLEERSR